ncbi:MAG: CoA transferase [Blastocatellia bacterium]|nr:CoA transferase [Blastocatellia bacterium]
MVGSLSHLRVLDLSRILAGPYCTQMLADLGADVVKVERPGAGDDTRGWGPPFDESGMSAYFAAANRNKRSVALDLKTDLGREAVRRLAVRSDVVVENFRAGHLDAMGLGYDALAVLNPGLVFCSITGFGSTGPRRDEPGYDFLIQAMGGLMAITGDPDGEPMKVGVAVADLFAGTLAAVAILAALAGRGQSGRGQRIDMSLYDSQLSMLANVASSHLFTGVEPRRYGNAHPNIVPYQTLAASDGRFALALGSDGQWAALCRELGRDDLAIRLDLATNAGRVVGRDSLIPDLERSFAALTVDEAVAACSRAGVPAGPVRGVAEAFNDPQTAARQMIVETRRTDGTIVPTVGSPLALLATPPVYRLAPPRLGEHTAEVLGEIGLDPPSD